MDHLDKNNQLQNLITNSRHDECKLMGLPIKGGGGRREGGRGRAGQRGRKEILPGGWN